MERYRDINGDSGVLAYETGPDFIRVQFKDHSVYLYTYIVVTKFSSRCFD